MGTRQGEQRWLCTEPAQTGEEQLESGWQGRAGAQPGVQKSTQARERRGLVWAGQQVWGGPKPERGEAQEQGMGESAWQYHSYLNYGSGETEDREPG